MTNSNIKNLCEEYINTCQDKSIFKTTTSRKFKRDLVEYFANRTSSKVIELGTAHGHTTKLLSLLFDKIVTIDNNADRIAELKSYLKTKNITNVLPVCLDLYTPEFLQILRFETNHKFDFDIAIIDAYHTYDCVIKDTLNMYNVGCKTFVYDDYGLFPEVKAAIAFIINTMGEEWKLKSIHHIGMPTGTFYPNTINKLLTDWEGIILEFE